MVLSFESRELGLGLHQYLVHGVYIVGLRKVLVNRPAKMSKPRILVIDTPLNKFPMITGSDHARAFVEPMTLTLCSQTRLHGPCKPTTSVTLIATG